MFYFDSSYYLVLLGVLISLAASFFVKSRFQHYAAVMTQKRLPAKEAAAMILQSAGIDDVRIERISGHLSDHYSPKERVLRLSDSVYASSSVAAIGVAAHECGHAIQHKQGYLPLRLRSLSVPVANIGSMLSFPLVAMGLILGYTGLARIGVFLFLFVVLFQLITLPVEFNASGRALRILKESGMLAEEELSGAAKVLRAAALTYLAAVLTSVLQLLRLMALSGRRR